MATLAVVLPVECSPADVSLIGAKSLLASPLFLPTLKYLSDSNSKVS